MKKSSFARAAEAVLIALALCVMAVLVFSVQRLSEKSNLAALSAVGGWYRIEDGERVIVNLPDVLSDDAPVALYTDALTAADAGACSPRGAFNTGLKSGWGTSCSTATSRPRSRATGR